MGRAIVRLNEELFNSFLTQGNSWPTTNGESVVCVKGLPPGARIVKISMDVFFNSDEIAIIYEHPDLPEVNPGYALPTLEVAYNWVVQNVTLAAEMPAPVTIDAVEDAKRTIQEAESLDRAAFAMLDDFNRLGRSLRTRAEVEAARRTPSGCCSRYADYKTCTCLEDALDLDEPERSWTPTGVG